MVIMLIILFISKITTKKVYDYCIIGAGPAGLQMAYYFESVNFNYIVFEQNKIVGSSFYHNNQTVQLLSYNKRYTGSNNTEFNLRFDWNSLLTDDEFRFTSYSKKLYPTNKEYMKYLNDFYKRYKLKIKFSTKIINIKKFRSFSTLINNQNKTYHCNTVILANGEKTPHIIKNEYIKTCDEKLNFTSFSNINLIFICLNDYSSYLSTILPTYTASTTFYVEFTNHGFVFNSNKLNTIRSINAFMLDSYQLKSLDVIDSGVMRNFNSTIRALLYLFDNYQILFCCQSPDSFSENKRKNKNKYIKIGLIDKYFDRTDIIYSYIVQFRYLIRFKFKKIVMDKYKIALSNKLIPINKIVEYMLNRINEDSGLFRQHALSDIYLIDSNNENFLFIKEFQINEFDNLFKYINILTEKNCSDIFLVKFDQIKNRVYNYGFIDMPGVHSNKIHPAIYHTNPDNLTIFKFDSLYHFDADIFMEWDSIFIHYNILAIFIFKTLNISYIKESDIVELLSTTYV